MKKWIGLFVAITICVLTLSPSPVHTQGRADAPKEKFRRSERVITNQYIVVLKDTVPQGKVAALALELARSILSAVSPKASRASLTEHAEAFVKSCS
jgi:hypothetical protein